MLPRIDQSGICFGKRGLANCFVRTAAEAWVPFAYLLQRRRTGRLPGT
jgi:hypothetical protein